MNRFVMPVESYIPYRCLGSFDDMFELRSNLTWSSSRLNRLILEARLGSVESLNIVNQARKNKIILLKSRNVILTSTHWSILDLKN